MLDRRTATLIGSDLLFIAVSLALILHPEWAAGIFPLYGLIFFWSDSRGEADPPIIFIFLVSAAGLVLAARPAAPDRGALMVQLGGLWLLAWAISAQRGRALREQREAALESLALEAQIKDDERDLKYYRSYHENVGGQIRLRRDLTESAKSLGCTMDSREVRERLLAILSSRFPNARVQIVSAARGDALLQWAAQRRGPVFLKDAAADQRFRGAGLGLRSAMVIPLKVMRQAAGFLRLESDAPGAFGPEDVKTADLFATMASLSLENIQFYEQVHEQATHDSLTHLHSHKAFQERLAEELLRAGRNQTPLSIILADIDHFKTYNDRYGHQAGDHLLCRLAAILSAFARPVDLAARYGGEEFALVLPNFVRSEAVDLANRIRLRVAGEPFLFQGEKTGASMSFGVAGFPQDATTASQMIRVADERLYRAKANGRNQVVG